MILVVDIGNTQIKGAVFEKDSLIFQIKFPYELLQKEIEKILKEFFRIEVLVIASVGKLEKEAFSFLQNRIKIHYIHRDSIFPFVNNYSTPATLGIDRMVLAAGAVFQFPKQNRLIIDVGTCITYDFVDAANVYHGGAISPGIRLRYEAMHNFTAKLPLLEKEEPKSIIGDSTAQSMHAGVIHGITFEIDGYITELQRQNENFIIILTGGDANFLAKRLKNTIFANSNFLQESLCQLYQYQSNND